MVIFHMARNGDPFDTAYYVSFFVVFQVSPFFISLQESFNYSQSINGFLTHLKKYTRGEVNDMENVDTTVLHYSSFTLTSCVVVCS